MKVAILYGIIISLVALILTALDKSRAKHGGWRVPEKTLFAVALLGGAAAMFATMRVIRHKTRHKRFMLGLPTITLLQCGLLLYIAERFFE